MKELDKSKVYDLSELNSKELKEIWFLLKKNDIDWFDCEFGEVINESDKSVLYFDGSNWAWDNTIKLEEATNAKELFEPTIPTLEEFKEKCETANELLKSYEDKPKHYANGIDTFERMEANCTIDECLAFAKGNIDKYNFRKKGQDLEDYTKIIAYANWAIKLLNKK